MTDIYNVYCDESCHLENDHKPIMAIAAVWCPLEKTKQISREIRQIKLNHNLSRDFEIKWIKASPAKIEFYLELVDYFFSENDLHFRIVLIEKSQLDHKHFDQTHDDWYYKMAYQLLDKMIDPKCKYRIYMDIKDTRSEMKCRKLEQYLRNKYHDFTGYIIERTQQIKSKESSIMQMTDFLMGAVRHFKESKVTGELKSKAKNDIINHIIQRCGKSLLENTWPKESKFNIFHWKGEGEK